jgi:iron complex outermembrane receptor protein
LTHEDIATGNIDWRFHGQKLSYVADYWDWGYTTGVGGNIQIPGETESNGISEGTYPQSTQWTYGQELRLASDEPNRFWDYTAGVYYRHTLDHVYNFTGGSQEPGAFGSPLAPNPFVFNNNYVIYTDTVAPRVEKEFSANLYLTFHLPGNNELSAGGRYIDYKDNGTINTQLLPGSEVAEPASLFHNLPCALLHFTSTYPGTCNISIPGSPDVFSAVVNGKGHPVVYNVSLSHKFNDDLMAYFTSGSSWRPPAFTVGVINGTNNPVLNSILNMNPEKSYSFEGGIKSTWLDKRIRLNLDYYHQIYSPAIAGGSQSEFYLSNNGVTTPTVAAYPFSYNVPATVNGIDLDAGAQITKTWTADLSAGWASSHVSGTIPCNPPGNSNLPSAFPAGTVLFQCLSNQSLSTRPNFSGSLRSEYDYPVNDQMNAFLRGLYSYYGRNPNALSNTGIVEPGYGVLNLYLGLRSPSGAWEVDGFVKNALNTQKIITTGGPDLTNTAAVYAAFGDAGYHSAIALTPRQEFGLTVTYAFGSR